jgi:sugar phosphate isomerase/epimerase
VRFAICNELFEGWEFARVCEFVKSTGYDGIELAPFTLAPAPSGVEGPLITALDAGRRRELRQQAADAGVQIIGLHWLLARTSGLHLTSGDEATRRRTTEYLVSLAEACRDLGGSIMVFGSPAQRSLSAGVSREQAFGHAARTFEGLLPALDACDVTLCLEPLGPEETNFLNTCAETQALIERIGHPRMALHLDVKAMSTEATPMTDLIHRYGRRAGHFHANDPNRRGPGFGDVDFAPVFAALEESGYNRWVSVEVFDFSPDPETVARESIEYMQKCRPQAHGRGPQKTL